MHTRVSDELDEALQDAARRLRVPVSNLVRNVLEDVFDAVEAVTENVGELVEGVVEEAQDFGRRFERRWQRRAESARERIVEMEREPAPPRPPAPGVPPAPPEFADVSAWQPVVLNGLRECAACGCQMRRGDPAYLGMGVTSGPPPILCETCLDRE
ncbi:MAG: ribbon-helix-helix domain-containing protein [Myxococcota bacterium]